MERRVPTKDEVLAYLKEDRNWGRWGDDDQVGAVNMVTAEKRLQATRTVKTGRAVCLSREFPKNPAPNNPTPALHPRFLRPRPRLCHPYQLATQCNKGASVQDSDSAPWFEACLGCSNR